MSITLFGQNFILKKENRFHVAASYSNLELSKLVDMQIGYTYKGRVSTYLTLGSESRGTYTRAATTVRPEVNVLIIRQNDEEIPISVNVTGGYQWSRFNDFQESGGFYFFGSDIYKSFLILEYVRLIPGIRIGWRKASTGDLGPNQETTVFRNGLDLNLVYRELYVTPFFYEEFGLFTYGMRVGYIL